MKIVVCIKQIPKFMRVKDGYLQRDSDGMMNPVDRHALEEALVLKAQLGAEVIVLTMGPKTHTQVLRESLAMGADRAILLSSTKFAGADTLATAYVLSKAIQKIDDVRVVFFGKASYDADTGQVAPITAELLDYPQVTYAAALTYGTHDLIAKRRVDDCVQTVRATYPVVVSVLDTINQPRYANTINIQKAFREDIAVWDEQTLQVDESRIGLVGSPTIVDDTIPVAAPVKETLYLTGTPEEAVASLMTSLQERYTL